MRKPFLLCLALLGLWLVGCAVAAGAVAGGAAIVYIRGEAKRVYPASLDLTHQATLKAMSSKDLVILEQKPDGRGWYLRSRRPSDAAEVHIRVVPRAENSAEVGVRVGVTGDRDYSESFLAAVSQNL